MNTYRSGLWPDTKLWYEGKAVTQMQALPLFFPLHESTREWTNSIGSSIPYFFPGLGETIPLLHQGRSADFHSTDQVD